MSDMAVTSNRRTVIGGLLAAGAATILPRPARAAEPVARVIVDNDFSGDPDGLFQLAHHLLCDGVSIPLIIGSHLPSGFGGSRSAQDSAAEAATLARVMRLSLPSAPITGASGPLPSRTASLPSAATASIVAEAMLGDPARPLIYAAGAGLTELALAWRAEPRIGRRLRLVWIGGKTPPGVANAWPEVAEPEFNLQCDPIAAQIIFNESDIPIWQVPEGAYRRMLLSTAELDMMAEGGPLGRHLGGRVEAMAARIAAIPGAPALLHTDALVLGDSPLVTLTALVPPIAPDPSSSRYTQIPTPRLGADGRYTEYAAGRPMRVYTDVDANLTFRDMQARFMLLNRKLLPDKQ